MHSKALSYLVLVPLGVASTSLLSRVARAQDQQAPNRGVIDQLVQINKKALADCDSREWAAARRALLDALATAKKAGLDRHPITARTYVHLGAVYVMGFKDRQKALQSFIRRWRSSPTSRSRRA